jgi:hypothetical protein
VRLIALLALITLTLSCVASAPTTIPSATPATATVPPSSTIVLTPAPTASPAPATVMTEAAAWSRVKSATQSSVAMPTWLPPSIDRATVEVTDLAAAPAGPRYTVVYRTAQGGAIAFALGPADPIPGSGMGVVVRGQDASLTFPSTVFTDPAKPARRRVRWVEGPLVLSITSDVFTGDDLLRIAWNLDPFSAPPPKNAFSRTADACGATGPEATVRTLVSLIGRQRTEAVADCFSAEYLGRSGMGVPDMWASKLPTATLDGVSPRTPIGGRPVVQVSWTFASDPGGAWNQKQTMFFTLGLESDRFRIYEIGTAGGGPVP